MLVLLLAASMTAPEVLAKVSEKATETARIRHEQGWTGIKHETKHDIGDPEAPSLTEETEWQLTTVPDGFLAQLVKRNGSPVTDAQPERPKVDVVAYLGTKYNVRMASPEPIEGYYVLAFEPKNPDAPVKGSSEQAATDAIIDRLSGIAYIDQNTFFVRRVIGSLRKGFSVATVGRVSEATVHFEQDLINGLAVPTRSVFEARSSKFLFVRKSQRISVDYTWTKPVIIETQTEITVHAQAPLPQ